MSAITHATSSRTCGDEGDEDEEDVGALHGDCAVRVTWHARDFNVLGGDRQHRGGPQHQEEAYEAHCISHLPHSTLAYRHTRIDSFNRAHS